MNLLRFFLFIANQISTIKVKNSTLNHKIWTFHLKMFNFLSLKVLSLSFKFCIRFLKLHCVSSISTFYLKFDFFPHYHDFNTLKFLTILHRNIPFYLLIWNFLKSITFSPQKKILSPQNFAFLSKKFCLIKKNSVFSKNWHFSL